VPDCPDLKKRLHLEANHLFSHATRVDLNTVTNGHDKLGYGKLTWREKLLNRIGKDLI